MEELNNFLKSILKIINVPLDNTLSIEQARYVIKEMNDFLYTSYDQIGEISALNDEKTKYFSEFHRYWEKNHKEIINAKINEGKCIEVADVLHDIFIKTNGEAFTELYDTYGLKSEEICKVRLLTANQDFRGSRNFIDLAKIYKSEPSIFDLNSIFDDPEKFIKKIGITKLSQNDKRVLYAKVIAKFLINLSIEPYDLFDKFKKNVYEIRKTLTSLTGAGYGNKKADMFLRDMVVLNIWKEPIGFEKIDVASDVNTIKVALRSGILTTDIPLVSSFLDIFCHQYGHIYDLNAKAWRAVWEIWKHKYPKQTIISPCLMDYFIYGVIGRQFCKEILRIFKCDKYAHEFKWYSGHNKICKICSKNKEKQKAKLIGKLFPCMDREGHIAINKTKFGKSNILKLDNCPFSSICKLSLDSVVLQPPKSISIRGQTSWESAYTKKEAGGGGLMA